MLKWFQFRGKSENDMKSDWRFNTFIMWPFLNVQVIVFLGLVALGSSQHAMSCEECTGLCQALADASTSASGIEAQLNVITEPVCGEVPDDLECRTNLPTFWGAIAKTLFTVEGWWNPMFNCPVMFTCTCSYKSRKGLYFTNTKYYLFICKLMTMTNFLNFL